MEREKILEEYRETLRLIEELEGILADDRKVRVCKRCGESVDKE